MSKQPFTPEGCAAAVGDIVARIFRELDAWREAIADRGPSVRVADLDSLVEGFVVPELTLPDPLLIGAGFIAAPRYVHGRDVHFAWWLGPVESNPLLGNTSVPTRLDLSARVYAEYLRDFRTLEWYQVPESTHQRHITGPYVDHLCTCDYILTLTMPVRVEDEMVGVVGADIYVKRLERELLPLFLALDEPVVLLSEVGRVVVSTEPTMLVGDILPNPQHSLARYTQLPCTGTPLLIAIGASTAAV